MNKNKTLKETFSEALQNYKKKDFKNAEIVCYKILSIDPNHVESISMLATISVVKKNFLKAKELMIKAVEIQPDNKSYLNNLGTAYRELGDLKEAENIYKKILKIDSEHTNANYNLGLIFYQLGELKTAKNYLQKTVNIQKNYAIAFFSLGNLHVDLKEQKEAISCYQKAIEINPNIVSAHNNLGLLYRELNDFQNAINCYKQAIEIQPNHAGAHHNLALAYKEVGDFKNAIKCHQSAIEIEPQNATHYYYLSDVKKDILDSKLRIKLENILNNKSSTILNIAYVNYLLAKFEKNKENYSKEMEYLIEGHQNYFKSKKKKFELGVKYCFEDVLQISESVSVSNLTAKEEILVKPIFIIGVPRCGSTLVEKIIGSGEKLIPMGEETMVFENFLNKKILEKQSLDIGDAKTIRKEINDIYKQKGLMLEKSDFTFTDKSLNNFFYLNIIKSLYPNAKIINCKRDVLSSIMSIFQNNLTELAWTHNLENIFKYFNNYFKIIDNFKSTDPDFVYELNFEQFTQEPLEESKKLMKFCGLPWDKKCLEYYKRKDLFSKTASNIQIRGAIFKHSSDKYLPYKKIIEKYGIKYPWFS